MSHVFLLVLLGLLGAPQPASTTANDPGSAYIPVPESAQKKIEFVGFSKSEELSAWKLEVQQPQVVNGQNYVDHYNVIMLVATGTGKPIGCLRLAEIYRSTPAGKRVAVASAQLSKDNPAFAQSASLKQWQKLKSMAQFWFKPIDMKDGVLRLSLDDDTQIKSATSKEKLTFDAEDGQPVGFHPMLRLMDGRLVALGYFRHEGNMGQALHGSVRAFRSRTGYHTALIAQFASANAPTKYEAAVLRTTEPLGINDGMGQLRMQNHYMRIGGDIFKELHPELKMEWEQYAEHE